MKSFSSIVTLVVLATTHFLCACAGELPDQPAGDTTTTHPTSGDNAGLTLPSGFSAVVVAENLGGVRHIAVDSNGDIYAKLSKLKDGKGILELKGGDAGHISSFGNFPGTGIAIKNGYLYATSNTSIFRYKLDAGNQVADPDKPEIIVKDLTDRGSG